MRITSFITESEKGKLHDTVGEQFHFWAQANACDPTSLQQRTRGPITARRFEQCASGVVVYSVRDEHLGHSWPTKYDDTVVNFFESQDPR